MSDRHESSWTPPDPAPTPEERHRRDPESDRPFREAFARRLPSDARRNLEAKARAAYAAALEEHSDAGRAPGQSDTEAALQAVVVDLHETAAVLEAIAGEYLESELDTRDTVLCLLASPRWLEVAAIAERVERVLAWRPTAAAPLPADLASVAVVPTSQ